MKSHYHLVFPALLAFGQCCFASDLKHGLTSLFKQLPDADSAAQQLERSLAIGDFARFNELFGDMQITLPGAELGQDGLELNIDSITCSDIELGDIQSNYTVIQDNNNNNNTTGAAETLAYTLSAFPFAMKCSAAYSYNFLFFMRGGGTFEAITRGNKVETRIDLTSPEGFQNEPPTIATVNYCKAEIETNGNISFDDDPLGQILALVKDLISGLLETSAATLTCQKLEEAGPDFMGKLLNMTRARVDEWNEPIPLELLDPLFPESNFTVPDGVSLLNLQENGTESTIGSLFVEMIKEVDTLFGDDPGTVDPATGEVELGINAFLRDMLLDENGTFAVELDDMDVGGVFDPVILESHDNLVEATIALSHIKIVGLDTLQTFEPFQAIGNYTISTELAWESLTLDVGLDIDIKPSSLPDAFLVNPNKDVSLAESITISVDVTNLDVSLAVFMAVNEERLDALSMGSLLNATDLLPCLLSAMEAAEVSGLDVSIEDISVPVLNNFSSPGIARLTTDLVDAAFVAFEPTLIRAVPGIFQRTVRSIVKDSLLDGTVQNSDKCPEASLTLEENGGTSFLDFRDLFLKPEDAVALGGAGNERYGNIGHMAYDVILKRFTEVGDDGLPRINDLLIRPFTESQSGVPGTIRFPETLFDFGSSLQANNRRALEFDVVSKLGLNISLGNMRITNLDTVVPPLDLLGVTDSPWLLNNEVNLAGGTGRALNLTLRITSALEGDIDEIDVTVAMDSTSVFAAISALVNANEFLQFPLGDVLDLNCWLSTLPAVQLDSDGFAIDSSADRGLSLYDFIFSLSALSLDTKCISCDSLGTYALPTLMEMVQDTGALDLLEQRAPSLIDSIARSESVQTLVDRLISDAPKLCPSRPEYNPNTVKSDYSFIGLPALPAESLDTVLFSAAVAIQVGFIVFIETNRLKEYVPTDPLSAQQEFQAPEDIRLLDWTAIGNSTGLGGIADQVFNQGRSMLGGGKDDGLFDFGEILSNLASSAEGVVELKTAIEYESGGIFFSLDTIKVRGLDSLALSDVFEPIGPQTLSLSASFDDLDLELVFVADSPTTQDPPQILTARFAASDVTADVALFAAFDLDRVGSLELGSLLHSDSLISCIMSTAYAFEIPQMKVSIGSFDTPVVEGLMPETGAVLDLLIDTTFDRFKSEIEEALPRVFDGFAKDMIADLLASADGKNCERSYLDSTGDDFVDFRDLILPPNEAARFGGSGSAPYGNVLSTAYTFMKEKLFAVDPDTGLAAINSRILAGLGEAQSGTPGRLFFPGNIFVGDRQLKIGKAARLSFRLSDAYINNLDSFAAPLTLAHPVKDEAHMLENDATVGVGNPLQAGIRVFFSLSSEESEAANDLDISISMDTLRLLLTLLAKVSERAFLQFPIRDLAQLSCWLATIPAPDLDAQGLRQVDLDPSLMVTDFAASIEDLGLNVSCIECSGPRFAKLGELLDTFGESNEVTALANGVFDVFKDLLEGNFFQVAADRAIVAAKQQCPHSKQFDPDYVLPVFEPFETSRAGNSTSFFAAIIIVVMALGVFVVAVILSTKLVVRRRHRKWVESLSNRHKVKLLLSDQEKEDEKYANLNENTNAMVYSDCIPLWLRMSMPLIILGNIGLFLSGHLNLGGSVSIMGSIGGENFEQGNFYDFSMAKSTVQIWEAGARELAMIIFIFSFAWPYTKQMLTLGLWFAPPSRVTVQRRESILLWLDALAKWSMIDIFVLIVTIVCFRVSIKSPDIEYLPEDLYSLDLLVVPKWGLYANMTAQLVSQLSSHWIIHYHRRMVELASSGVDIPDLTKTATAVTEKDEESGEDQMQQRVQAPVTAPTADAAGRPARLFEHAFRRPHRGESDKLVIRRYVSPSLIGLALCLCVLVITGCVVPSYSVNYLGIVGVFVEFGQDLVDANMDYNVFSTIKLLFDQANLVGGASNYIGLGTLSILLVLTVLVVPVLQCAVLVVQWVAPLTRKRRHRLSVALEILQAWQYTEVYLLALLVASWQIGPISEFMVNPFCQPLQGLFSELVFYGILKAEDAQCFRTDVAVKPTFYILFAAALVLAFLNAFVMKAVAHFFRDQDDAEKTSTPTYELESIKEPLAVNSEDTLEQVGKLHPAPVLFTDRYRWLLYREDVALSRRASSEDVGSHSLSVLDGTRSEANDKDIAEECHVHKQESDVERKEVEEQPQSMTSANDSDLPSSIPVSDGDESSSSHLSV